MAADPPPGYEFRPRAPYINHVGPIWQWTENEPGTMRLALRVADVHSNTMGYMHGGMIATMVDSAMARAMHAVLGRRALTLKMGLEYLDAVKVGELLEVHGRLVAADEQVAQTEALVKVGESLRARGTGLFRLLRKR
ncbi:MAG: hypothetical protein GC155_00970 [Alphaproteobacteria bacterium]|nr:hypothetical protein [Alphaproteobacteria bacterium]